MRLRTATRRELVKYHKHEIGRADQAIVAARRALRRAKDLKLHHERAIERLEEHADS